MCAHWPHHRIYTYTFNDDDQIHAKWLTCAYEAYFPWINVLQLEHNIPGSMTQQNAIKFIQIDIYFI